MPGTATVTVDVDAAVARQMADLRRKAAGVEELARGLNDTCDQVWGMREQAAAALALAESTGAAAEVVAALRTLAGPLAPAVA